MTFDAKTAGDKLRVEHEVKLRLLIEARNKITSEIRFLEQLLKGGERG